MWLQKFTFEIGNHEKYFLGDLPALLKFQHDKIGDLWLIKLHTFNIEGNENFEI